MSLWVRYRLQYLVLASCDKSVCLGERGLEAGVHGAFAAVSTQNCLKLSAWLRRLLLQTLPGVFRSALTLFPSA